MRYRSIKADELKPGDVVREPHAHETLLCADVRRLKLSTVVRWQDGLMDVYRPTAVIVTIVED